MIGVMQGRLLPKFEERYQAHPIGYWQTEFSIAQSLGLSSIEFILDYDRSDQNPLISENGANEIIKRVEDTGVLVRSICADYFMEAPLHSQDDKIVAKSSQTLIRLMTTCTKIGARDIVIPCVDHASLSNAQDRDRLVEVMAPLVSHARETEVNLCLETDLGPADFADLLDRFGSPSVTVNYDTGNSASLGYSPTDELAAYGDRITDIHIKDRVLGGGPTPLGTGAVNFGEFIPLLEKLDFDGPLIMQAYRDDEGVEIFRSQLEWFKQRLPTSWETR